MTAVVAAALLIGVVTAAFIGTTLSSAPMVGALAAGAFFFFCVVFTLGVSIAASLGRDRARIIAALEASSQVLQRRLVRWRQMQWYQQKSLSRALHGPVQASVTAGALRLDAAIRAGQADPAVIDQVRGQLLQTLGCLGSLDTLVASVKEALDRITSTWEGLCAVSTSLEDDANTVIRRDTALRSCVIDIVTEASSNAVRHGGATRVDVTISFTDSSQRDLLLVIASDGHRQDKPLGRGLGTLMLDECTLEWRLDDADAGTTLIALLPMDA